ncbi:MAG: TIGR02597 family protein [Verrucomicrobiaceae bacterium]|nr:TIGR02597 family protein [Verrucomicrobiaceae bacterium]
MTSKKDPRTIQILRECRPIVTTTDGNYAFTNLVAGSYVVKENQPVDYVSVSDGDSTPDTPLAPVDSTNSPSDDIIAVTTSPGETDSGNDFIEERLYDLCGQVRYDSDRDGSLIDPDVGLSGFSIRLYQDTDSSGGYTTGDVLLNTKITDTNGDYCFNDLPSDEYIVVEIPPHTELYNTNDQDRNNDRAIPVAITNSDSDNNDFLEAADPQGWFYDVETCEVVPGGSVTVTTMPVGGSVNMILNGSNGEYSWLTNGVSGVYAMTVTPPPGYIIDPSRPSGATLDPTGLSDPYYVGSGVNGTGSALLDCTHASNPWHVSFELTSGDPFVLYNNIPLIRTKPITFAGWQILNTLGGQNGATQDPDGDGLTNLQEFAFCYPADSGVATGCPLEVVRNLDDTLDAHVRRVTGAAVTYTLEYISELALSGAGGAGWTAITSITPVVTTNVDGTEEADYRDLAQIPALSSGKGFVRVVVSNGSSTARTYAAGWGTQVLEQGCQTCSQPYLQCALFRGAVDSVSGSLLHCTTSAGASNIASGFVVGRQYYIEVASGDHVGHRWEVDEASSDPDSIAIDTSSVHNTQTTLPASLAGDVILLRAHTTLEQAFPPASFTGTSSPTTADRILVMDRTTSAFRVYWLFNGTPKRWVASGDATLTSLNNTPLYPGFGHFIHPKGGTVTQIYVGHVRENAFAYPLSSGTNLVSSPWPMDQSPSQRGMTAAAGFTGTRNATSSDKISLWAGDTTPGTEAYDSHFYLISPTRNQWTPQANASLINENDLQLFPAHRSSVIRVINPVNWLMPLPWTP